MSRTTRKRWRLKGGTLVLLSSFLIGSAVVRVGFEAGPAIARELASGRETELLETPYRTQVDEEAQRKMLALFEERDGQLNRREAELRDKMQALKIAEEAVARQLQRLTVAEERLRATLAIADEAAERDLARLTGVYERMKPKEAAALFEEMDPKFAAGFLARMKPEAAAGILANIAPGAAYTISVVLAGRNARAPKQ